jgi:hypothetical protein
MHLKRQGRDIASMLSDDEYYESDASEPKNEPNIVTDPEVWMDHWSEELVTLWHALKDHSFGMGCAILDACDFPAFAEFCFKHSSGHPPVV